MAKGLEAISSSAVGSVMLTSAVFSRSVHWVRPSYHTDICGVVMVYLAPESMTEPCTGPLPPLMVNTASTAGADAILVRSDDRMEAADSLPVCAGSAGSSTAAHISVKISRKRFIFPIITI